jgi:hypothetical protein
MEIFLQSFVSAKSLKILQTSFFLGGGATKEHDNPNKQLGLTIK